MRAEQPPRAAVTDRRGALSQVIISPCSKSGVEYLKTSEFNPSPPHPLTQTVALPLVAGAVLGFAGAPPSPSRAAAKKGPSGPSFEETMATLLLAKEVLGPVKRYIEIGQFDPGTLFGAVLGRWTVPTFWTDIPPCTPPPMKPARTNIKYVVNQFRIKKAMERAVLLAFDQADADPSKLDDAAEVCRCVSGRALEGMGWGQFIKG